MARRSVDFDGKQALEDITTQQWSEALTKKHSQKMSKGIENLGYYLSQIAQAN